MNRKNFKPAMEYSGEKPTWKLPRIVLVEVNFGDDGDRQGQRSSLLLQIVNHQLLVGRVKPESRR